MDKCKTRFILTFCGSFLLIGLVSIGGSLYLVIAPVKVNFNLDFDDAKKAISDMYEEINKCENLTIDYCKKLNTRSCGVIIDYCHNMKIHNPPNIADANPWPNTDFSVIVKWFGMFLCVFGCALCVMSLTGIAWIWIKRNWLKRMFATFMIILLLVEIAIAVIYLKYHLMIDKYISKVFLETFDENYTGLLGHDEVSMAWNIIMKKFDCCGVHNYTDVSSSQTFNDTWISIFHSVRKPRKTEFPLVCCNTIDILPKDRFSGPCDDLYYKNKKGCVEVFWDALSNYNTAIIVYVVVSSILKIISIVISYTTVITREDSCKVKPLNRIPKKRIDYPQKVRRYDGKSGIQEDEWYPDKSRGHTENNNIQEDQEQSRHPEKITGYDRNNDILERNPERRRRNIGYNDIQHEKWYPDWSKGYNKDGDIQDEKWYDGTRPQPMKRPTYY